jgi:AcrR family transcriptional regulator
MELKTNNKEQIILEVAEKLFIEKGYAGTKTTDIAKEAGVNHALLHYYFRTKENLFNQIFEQKVSQIWGSFTIAFDSDSSFFEKIKDVIETHFEVLNKSPKLPLFILREIVTDNDRKAFILKKLMPVGKNVYKKLKSAIREEMQKGAICPVKTTDLLLNIASLNVFAFVAAQVLFDLDAEKDRKRVRIFLEERKRNNVELIINSLKP